MSYQNQQNFQDQKEESESWKILTKALKKLEDLINTNKQSDKIRI